MVFPEGTELYLVGGTQRTESQLAESTGRTVRLGFPEAPKPGDVVLLDASTAAGPPAMPQGNAFAACRRIKRDTRVRVYLLVSVGDTFSPEIARFCLADGCLEMGADGELSEPGQLREWLTPIRRGAPIDALLEKLERGLAADQGRFESGLQRLVERADKGPIEHLTDVETGLFDGPFASYKLDEEYKRAMRFHQPLSLILFDCCVEEWPPDPVDRRTLLAEMAAIFLNECRDIDILARFTDRVFLCLLPGTGRDGAATVAHRMFDSFCDPRAFSMSVQPIPAVGIATVPSTGIASRKAFLVRAEACLVAAQDRDGAERVCASWE